MNKHTQKKAALFINSEPNYSGNAVNYVAVAGIGSVALFLATKFIHGKKMPNIDDMYPRLVMETVNFS